MRGTLRATALALLAMSACADPQASAPPEIRLVDMQQLESTLRAPRSRALLVVFWATWCDPCIEEIPDLVTLHEQSAEHLEILGVSLDAFLHSTAKSVELVRQQLERTPTPYAHVVYTGRQDPLFEWFDMPGGIPYAVLYERNGGTLQRFPGRVSPDAVREALGLASLDG